MTRITINDIPLRAVIQAALATKYSNAKKMKIGAVVFKGRVIISLGWNFVPTRNIAAKFVKKHSGLVARSIHAEMAALLRAGKKAKGASLFVYRHNFNTTKPCYLCIYLIRKAKIKNLYYCQDGELHHERLNGA